ncbi:LacI family DNA-binding transcriptional regulator [Oceanispirochaeta sp. M2]|nr:LacI family DNA-binding transcriptional regulator [Oceanispirochaeta sp. M2]
MRTFSLEGKVLSTILDVERESGVSKSTISRFLHGRTVTEENRIKIVNAIDKLNYKMNPLASGLKTSTTFTVGVILPDITDSFFPPIIKEFERNMRENGYNVILSDYGNCKDNEIKQLEMLMDKKIDGVVLASSHEKGEHIQACIDEGLPVILLDRLIDRLDCDSITVDNYTASYKAISRCIEMGHRNIGAVYGDFYTDKERFRGVEKALKDHGIEQSEDSLIQVKDFDCQLEKEIADLLDSENRPTLLFCSNVYIGIGALKMRLRRKLNIPEDISVLVFDDIATFPNHDYVSFIEPEFSSIIQPLTEIGKYAAELLLERIKHAGEEYEPVHIELKTRLKMTDSVATVK